MREHLFTGNRSTQPCPTRNVSMPTNMISMTLVALVIKLSYIQTGQNPQWFDCCEWNILNFCCFLTISADIEHAVFKLGNLMAWSSELARPRIHIPTSFIYFYPEMWKWNFRLSQDIHVNLHVITWVKKSKPSPKFRAVEADKLCICMNNFSSWVSVWDCEPFGVQ